MSKKWPFMFSSFKYSQLSAFVIPLRSVVLALCYYHGRYSVLYCHVTSIFLTIELLSGIVIYFSISQDSTPRHLKQLWRKLTQFFVLGFNIINLSQLFNFQFWIYVSYQKKALERPLSLYGHLNALSRLLFMVFLFLYFWITTHVIRYFFVPILERVWIASCFPFAWITLAMTGDGGRRMANTVRRYEDGGRGRG